MPHVELVFYRGVDGSVPMLDWLIELGPKARDKCVVALDRLEELGYELRRPVADYLRDGSCVSVFPASVNYRMLYFFHERESVVVTHGLVKEKRVPPKEIELAIERRAKFLQAPQERSFHRED